jgi:hypothetical protein
MVRQSDAWRIVALTQRGKGPKLRARPAVAASGWAV